MKNIGYKSGEYMSLEISDFCETCSIIH